MSFARIKQLALLIVIITVALLSTSSSSSSTDKPRSLSITTTASTLIQYTSFSGATYQLHAFNGRYIRYALPDSWIAADGLTEEELRQLLDLTDITYAHLSEILSGEPQGSGLLTIAIVVTSAGDGGNLDGQGLNGAKGVEISPGQLSNLKQYLKRGQIPDTFIHEIVHNFDLFNHDLSYYADWRHAWTTFLIPYVQSYSQTGSLEFEASQILDAKISAYTSKWDQLGANASWANCVQDRACQGIIANEAWAGFMLRFARLHGVASIKGAFAYLEQYRARNPNPPQTPEGMNDLLVTALANGTHSNISCEIDYWKWSVTDQTRTQLSTEFPASNACLDNDGDGYSPLSGDTNDQNRFVHPGAVEVSNNLDDDADGIVDDLLLKETTDFPSQASESSPVVPVPTRIQGYAEAGGQDAIILSISQPGLLRFDLRNRGEFHGWISLSNRTAGSVSQSYYSLTSPIAIFAVDCPGQWVVIITPDAGLTASDPGGAGNYDLTIEEEAPPADAVALRITQGSAGTGLHLSTTVNQPQLNGVTDIRFWASGVGFIKTVPFTQKTEFDWTPPAQLDSVIGLRAELMSGPNPASRLSSPVWVNASTAAAAGLTTDLAMVAVTSAPAAINYDQNMTFGFAVTNNGSVAANNVSISISLDPTLQVSSLESTRGQIQLAAGASNISTIMIDRISEGQAVIFSLTISALKANGVTTSTVRVSSSTSDSDSSNNSQTITTKVTGQALPSPYLVEPLPLRTENTTAAKAVARGSLARAIAPLTGVSVTSAKASPDAAGYWPSVVGGIEVKVAGVAAPVITFSPATDISSTINSYRIDFVIPDKITPGTNVQVTVTYAPLNVRWSSSVEVVESAPALWAVNGTTVGDALVQDADNFIQITSGHPAKADNQERLVLYGTGIRHTTQGMLSVMAGTADGQIIPALIDYSGPQSGFPGLDEIIIRLPAALAGKGKVNIYFPGAAFQSQVSIPVN